MRHLVSLWLLLWAVGTVIAVALSTWPSNEDMDPVDDVPWPRPSALPMVADNDDQARADLANYGTLL